MESSQASTGSSRQTQEQVALAPVKQGKRLVLGIPKELEYQENRVALRPEAAALLVENGLDVWVEQGAGKSSKHADADYSNAGAKIVYDQQELFEQADIILKIAPPTLEELGYMKPGKAIFSALQMATLSEEYIQEISKKRITGVAFELLQDQAGSLPIVRTMSEIAGSSTMLIAGELLSNAHGGKGMLLGGITGVPPTKVVIIGAGTVGEYAARAALGLGAEVKVFDNNLYKLRRLKQSLGNHHLYTSTIDSVMLTESLSSCDVAIGALRPENGRTPVVVTEEMVAQMKDNSVIIDVSIDYGGCFETSHVTNQLQPTFRRHEVIHYCLPNIASRVARTATAAFSNYFTPLLLTIHRLGGVEEMMFHHPWFAEGVYVYNHCITCEPIADRFHRRFTDLSLILATRMG